MAVPSARSAFAALARPRTALNVTNAVASSSRYMSTTSTRLATSPTTSSSNEDTGSSLPVSLNNLKYLSFPKFKPLKLTHGVHVATLHLQSYHPYNLELNSQFAVHSAHSLKIPTSLPASLPNEKSLYTVLKSPFVKKKAQENFQRKTYKRAIKVYDATPEVIDLWLRYLRQNGLPGVGMKAYVHEYVELGFGQKEGLAAEVVDEKKIADAADELVKVLSESEESSTTSASAQEEAGAEVKGQKAENKVESS